MNMISDKFFVLMAVMVVVPFLCYVALPSPYDTISAMSANIAMIFIFRKLIKNVSGSILGTSKGKWSCLACNWNKFDNAGNCRRCGSSARRML